MYFRLQRALHFCVLFLMLSSLHSAQAMNRSLPPGLVCSAVLTGFQAIFPLKDDLESSTAFTARQLEAFLGYSLRRQNAVPKNKAFQTGGVIGDMSSKNLDRIANQISGIGYALNETTADPNFLKYGMSLRGTSSIEKYFTELEATVQTYVEMSHRPNLDAAAVDAKFYSEVSRITLPLIAMGMLTQGLDTYTAAKIVPRILSLYFIWSQLGAASVPLHGGTSEMTTFLTEAKDFLDHPMPVPRVMYFSHTYKILPKTFQQATSSGIMDTQTLVAESLSLHRARIPQPPFIRSISELINRMLPYSGPVSYVTIDFLIESDGMNPSDTNLHVFVRASKSNPKNDDYDPPSKPPKKEKSLKTAPGELIPIPVTVRR